MFLMNRIFLIRLFVYIALLYWPFGLFASVTDGTIDTLNRYAWGENIGWIDFGATGGNVRVNDSALSGYAWSENLGWISLNCANDNSCSTVSFRVANTSAGVLSGHAWSENAGWIDFQPVNGGVTIDGDGIFNGYAWGENIGWVSFNCINTNSCGGVDFKVQTDWRPSNVRPQQTQNAVIYLPPNKEPPELAATSTDLAELNNIIIRLAEQIKKVQSLINAFNEANSKVRLKLERDLQFGARGEDVKKLQLWLAKDEAVYPEGIVSGWFGPLTRDAVARFQTKYRQEILSSQGFSQPTGIVGTKTRAKLIQLYGNED